MDSGLKSIKCKMQILECKSSISKMLDLSVNFSNILRKIIFFKKFFKKGECYFKLRLPAMKRSELIIVTIF